MVRPSTGGDPVGSGVSTSKELSSFMNGSSSFPHASEDVTGKIGLMRPMAMERY